ncbi:MAG: hypothetical protein QHH06_07900 [Clostridiales bacterium]|jgi:hypothetical protein|nr:hypothetical protein [Eubacteriales bacterium]MDH7566388.1 hypothetical protein [Clostridiales bacterium]
MMRRRHIYCSGLEAEDPLSKEQRASVRRYLEEISREGMVREEIRSKTARLYWKV